MINKKASSDQILSPRDKVPKNLYKNFTIMQQQQEQQRKLAELMNSNNRHNKLVPPEDPQPRSRNSAKHKQDTIEEQCIGRISINLQQTMIELDDEKQQQRIQEQDNALLIKLTTSFKKQLLQQFKDLLKRHNYRKSIIKEIIHTEESYSKNIELILIINTKLKGIISSKEILTLFCNIKEISELSITFLELMKQGFDKFTYFSVFADKIKNIASFFKIYFSFSENYSASNKLLQTLKKNEMFKNLIKELEVNYLQAKTKDLENLLIQPVQRLPRYVLLFKDLLKNTDAKHPDFKNIQLVLEQFEKVNNDNNNLMDKNLKNLKLFELQRLFGASINILEANRNYIREESIKVYFHQETEVRPCIVYFLTDLILITERTQIKGQQEYILRNYIKLNDSSICRPLDDMKNYQNLFQLTGENQSAIFMASTAEDQFMFVQQITIIINQLIEALQSRKSAYQQNNLTLTQEKSLVSVHIVGNQENIDATGKKYTQYVIEIDIENISQKIFLRYKQFQKLQEITKMLFPKLKLQYTKDELFSIKNQAILVEQRKIKILDFLSLLLNTKEIQTNPTEILKLLGLPDNFYQLPSLLNNQAHLDVKALRTVRKPASMNVGGMDNLMKLRANMRSNQEETYLNNGPITPRGPPVKISRMEFGNPTPGPLRANSQANQRVKISAAKLIQVESRNNSKRGSMIMDKDTTDCLPIEIKVILFKYPGKEEKGYMISKETSAVQLVEEIANDINLQSAFDFKLYLLDKSFNKHLDDDEKLWNLLVRVEESHGLFKKSSRKVIYNEIRLQLRKHVFLSELNEKNTYGDQIRVELITFQLLDDITNYKLIITLKEYTIFTALYLYIQGKQIINEQDIPYNIIRQFLPPIAFKSIKQELWQNFLPTMMENFGAQILDLEKQTEKDKSISKQQQQQQQQQQDNLTESEGSQGDKNNQSSYAMLVFLNIVQATQFYGQSVFVVNIDKESITLFDQYCKSHWQQKQLQNKDLKIPVIESNHSILLCVNYKSIIFYQNYRSQQELLIINYENLKQINSHTQTLSIVVDFNTNTSDFQINRKLPVNFETEKSYQVKSLIDEYILLKQEEEEEDLNCNEIIEQN